MSMIRRLCSQLRLAQQPKDKGIWWLSDKDIYSIDESAYFFGRSINVEDFNKYWAIIWDSNWIPKVKQF